MEQTISVKELRLHLPRILQRLSRGEYFTLIYRSQPVGDLVPRLSRSKSNRSLRFWKNPGKTLLFKNKISAVNIVRELRK